MLYIQFQIGEQLYALNTDEIIEIVPWVNFHLIPGAPDYIAGVFNYRGQIVPVLDITKLTINKPAKRRLNTRIALVNFPINQKETRIIGIMGEKMADTIDIQEEDLQETGITSEQLIHLGPIANYKGTLIQCVNVSNLINKELVHKIFTASS